MGEEVQVKNEIVHVALVLDASSSMRHLASKVVQVADEQIKALKTRSEELDLETRISVYTFSYATDIDCIIFDKDVFRLPSIDGLYHAHGNTALIDATVKSQTDLSATAQMYGKHHFLTFVLTDGAENCSRHSAVDLRQLLARQGNNWSVAALVPDASGKRQAVSCGFPDKNVMVWDVSAAGLAEVSKKITEATHSYMTSVSRGTGYDKTNVFGTGADRVNAETIQAAGLVPMDPAKYMILPVGPVDIRIDDFVRNAGLTFQVGRGFYELTGKRVEIQGNKEIVILEKDTHRVFSGANARALLGLSSTNVKVSADANDKYAIFVQSTANNRKLLRGTRLFYKINATV